MGEKKKINRFRWKSLTKINWSFLLWEYGSFFSFVQVLDKPKYTFPPKSRFFLKKAFILKNYCTNKIYQAKYYVCNIVNKQPSPSPPPKKKEINFNITFFIWYYQAKVLRVQLRPRRQHRHGPGLQGRSGRRLLHVPSRVLFSFIIVMDFPYKYCGNLKYLLLGGALPEGWIRGRGRGRSVVEEAGDGRGGGGGGRRRWKRRRRRRRTGQ